MKNLNKWEKGAEEFKNNERDAKTEKLFGELKQLIGTYKNPEEFYSSGQYENLRKFEDALIQLGDLASQAVREKNFDEALDIGRRALEISGIEGAKHVGVHNPDDVIALTEAINWAAKTISYGFYSLKSAMIIAASQTGGVSFGYGDDGAYYLMSPGIGAASFHDPGDEVGYTITHILKQPISSWEYAWSEVSRQEDAFRILEDLSSGRSLAKIYADMTSPEDIKNARDAYMTDNFHERLTTIGELFNYKQEKRKV